MTAKQILVRSSITIALPFILIWAFAEELWRGLRSAFRLAWLEVRANIASYRDLIQREDF